MNDDSMDGQAAAPVDVLSGALTRLALRQLNQRALLPVLLHEVNGGLNGLALSAELLSRLLPSAASQLDAATGLLQRSLGELSRLKRAIKDLEMRLSPSDGEVAAVPLGAVLRDVRDVMSPAIRRCQLEWRAPGLDEPSLDHLRVAGADDSFQFVVAQAIVAIESAAPGASLVLSLVEEGKFAVVGIDREGAGRASLALEMHRELLRRAVAFAGGRISWQGARSRLALPRAED